MKQIILSVLLFTFIGTSYSQNWTPAIGTENKIVRSIIVYNGDTLLAGVDNEGLYISYDQGENWSQFALLGESIYSLLCINQTLVVGTEYNDFYRSTDIQSHWEHIPLSELTVNTIRLHNDTIFACTWGSIGPGALFTSVDTAKTWNQWGYTPPYAFINIDFDLSGRTFVSTPFGAYYSDYQSDWIQTTGEGGTIRSVHYIGSERLVYGSDFGTFISGNNGISMTESNYSEPGEIFFLDNEFYLAASYDLKFTDNINTPWVSLNLDKFVLTLIKFGDKIIAGTDEGIFIYDYTTSLISNEFSDYINVYPNPVKDFLHIDFKNQQKFTFYLYNSTGHLVLFTNNSKINFQNLNPGIYYYRIEINDRTLFGKLLKK